MAHDQCVRGIVVGTQFEEGYVRVFLRNGSETFNIIGSPRELGAEGYASMRLLRTGAFVECLCLASESTVKCLARQHEYGLNPTGAFSTEQIDRLINYSALIQKTRAWFAERGYVEVRLPSIHYGQNVGGSFLLDFQGEPARLSGANALYLNIMAMQLGKAFTLQRAFRLEPEYSSRHLAEFDLLEAGALGLRLPECMDLLEQLIRNVTPPCLGSQAPDSAGRQHPPSETPFPRVPYGHLALRYGATDNLDKHEREIAQEGPVFVINPPSRLGSWSARRSEDDRCCSFSLLLPEVGEVAEGAEENTNTVQLTTKFRALGLDRQLGWYAGLQPYPTAPLATIGLGVERLAMWSFGLQRITDVSPFFRARTFAEIPPEEPILKEAASRTTKVARQP
jgi:asparaginyl-tRNA synthetase